MCSLIQGCMRDKVVLLNSKMEKNLFICLVLPCNTYLKLLPTERFLLPQINLILNALCAHWGKITQPGRTCSIQFSYCPFCIAKSICVYFVVSLYGLPCYFSVLSTYISTLSVNKFLRKKQFAKVKEKFNLSFQRPYLPFLTVI